MVGWVSWVMVGVFGFIIVGMDCYVCIGCFMMLYGCRCVFVRFVSVGLCVLMFGVFLIILLVVLFCVMCWCWG